MKIGIREKIIRRLGGVPLWLAGRDPIPGWYLKPVESMIEQNECGICVTVKYQANQPEKRRTK